MQEIKSGSPSKESKRTVDNALAEFKRDYPIGTPVRFYPTFGLSDGYVRTRIASPPWRLGHGEIVVKIECLPGGVSINHIKKDQDKDQDEDTAKPFTAVGVMLTGGRTRDRLACYQLIVKALNEAGYAVDTRVAGEPFMTFPVEHVPDPIKVKLALD